MSTEEPWFVYWRRPGRIRGRAANWKGVLALTGGITATCALAVPTMILLIAAGRPLLGAAAMTVMLLIGIALIIRMVIAKGQRVS